MAVRVGRPTALVALSLVLGLLGTAGKGRAAEPDAEFMARLVAQSFFRGLLKGEIEAVFPLCAGTINFDGEQVKGSEAVKKKLEQLASRARDSGLRLKKVVVLTIPQVLQRYGPPPARIKKAVKPGRMVALARFNMMGAVAVLARTAGFWRIQALTD